MATSLRDISGARGRPRRRRPRGAWAASGTLPRAPILVDPRHGPRSAWRPPRRRPSLYDRRRLRLSPFDTFLLVVGLAVAFFLGRALWQATRVDVRSEEHTSEL